MQECCENYGISYQGQHLSQSINVFIRSHLDYADVFYGQKYPQKNRTIETQCCLALTGAS